jgi:hypothetical protein
MCSNVSSSDQSTSSTEEVQQCKYLQSVVKIVLKLEGGVVLQNGLENDPEPTKLQNLPNVS